MSVTLCVVLGMLGERVPQTTPMAATCFDAPITVTGGTRVGALNFLNALGWLALIDMFAGD